MIQKFRKSSLSASSKRWIARHQNDRFVRQAKLSSYRSRSAYKLIQLDDRDQLLQTGNRVLDLGASPGGWTQVAVSRVGSKTNAESVWAVDVLPMNPITGAKIIKGDFLTPTTQSQLETLIMASYVLPPSQQNTLSTRFTKLDVVLSDLSPNISGIRETDNSNAMILSKSALKFALTWLKPGGRFVCKFFHSQESEALIRECRRHFSSVKTRKPEASRQESREFFLVAINFQPLDDNCIHQ